MHGGLAYGHTLHDFYVMHIMTCPLLVKNSLTLGPYGALACFPRPNRIEFCREWLARRRMGVWLYRIMGTNT